MNNNKNNFLTSNQFGLLIIGYSVGPAFLKLPNALIEIAKQDAWISAIIGLLYPIYGISITIYIIRNHPKENIFVLSKKYFGNIIGSILNFIFMLQSIWLTASVTSDFINFLRIYIVSFLSPLKITVLLLFVAAVGAYKGLFVLGKVNEFITYSFIIVTCFSVFGLKHGSILNIQPVFGSGFSNILKALPQTAYAYIGWEAILLFYPFVKKSSSIKKSLFTSLFIAALIWIWTVFVTIFYLGIDILPKSYWSFVMVFDSIHIPIVNNFRYVFMFFWVFIAFRQLSIYYYASVFNLNELTKISKNKLVLLFYPLILYFSLELAQKDFLRKKVLDFATPAYVIFNLVFITLIALFILIKNKPVKNKKQKL